jgi:uncharacterized membrane protein YhaH (DUF805 family)
MEDVVVMLENGLTLLIVDHLPASRAAVESLARCLVAVAFLRRAHDRGRPQAVVLSVVILSGAGGRNV